MLRYRLVGGLLLFLFVNISISLYTPPRSPSPVPLESLNFDDDKNTFLLPTFSEREAKQAYNPTHINEHTPLPTMKSPQKKRVRRQKYSEKEKVEKARESYKRWRERKIKQDPDYVARLARNARERERERKMTGIGVKGKAGRPRKIFKTDDAAATCFGVDTPPRSPTPVSLDLLNFEDYKNAYLEPQSSPARSDSHHAHPQHVEVPPLSQSSTTIKPKEENPRTISNIRQPLKRGRKRILTDEQRARGPAERTKRWREKKKIEDPDFTVKQSKKRRESERKAILAGRKEKLSRKKRKARISDTSSER